VRPDQALATAEAFDKLMDNSTIENAAPTAPQQRRKNITKPE
jgi:hypothetical protein